MTATFGIEVVRELVDDESDELNRWTGWMASEGPFDEAQVIALAAAVRFSAAGCPRAKIERFLKDFLSSPPDPETDWVAVNRRGTKRIELHPGPFRMDAKDARRSPPIVFDPYPVFEGLRRH